MRKSTLITLLGLVIIVAGVGLTQISSKEEGKKVSYMNIKLTLSRNATLVIDLGKLSKGTRVEMTWLSDPALQVMMIRSDTKEPIPYDTPLEWDQIRLYGKFPTGLMVDNGGYHLKKNPLSYNSLPETAEYTVILSVPTYTPCTFFPSSQDLPDEVSIQNFRLETYPPAFYPYTVHGSSIIAIGLVVMVFGIIKGRRTHL